MAITLEREVQLARDEVSFWQEFSSRKQGNVSPLEEQRIRLALDGARERLAILQKMRRKAGQRRR